MKKEKGGKFIIHRNILSSDIWNKPHHFLKIWIWIIANANWKTIRRGGKTFNRGELHTHYEDIIRENEWLIGWRVERLTKREVFRVLDFLRKTQRITTRKATRGLWIKVLNYDYYQTLPKKKTNNEGNKEGNRVGTEWEQGKRKNNETIMKEEIITFSSNKELFNELIISYKEGKLKDYKPYYKDEEMRWSQSKWWVVPKDGGQWSEFGDYLNGEKVIIFKRKVEK